MFFSIYFPQNQRQNKLAQSMPVVYLLYESTVFSHSYFFILPWPLCVFAESLSFICFYPVLIHPPHDHQSDLSKVKL